MLSPSHRREDLDLILIGDYCFIHLHKLAINHGEMDISDWNPQPEEHFAQTGWLVHFHIHSGEAAILQHARRPSPGVKLHRIAEDMSEGRFDYVTRETVRAMHLLRLALVVAGVLVAAAAFRLWLR